MEASEGQVRGQGASINVVRGKAVISMSGQWGPFYSQVVIFAERIYTIDSLQPAISEGPPAHTEL